MKKLLFCFILLFSCIFSNQAQISSIDFFKFIDSDYVRTKIIKQQINDKDYEIISPFYELNTSEIQVGYACLYAISKMYPETWINEAKNGECSKIASYYSALLCEAKQLFKKDTLLLKRELDIYVFFINKEDLEGPFKEETDGGIYENYTPKKGSNMDVYKFDEILNKWVIIDEQYNINGEKPRLFGERFIKALAIQRINDFIKGEAY